MTETLQLAYSTMFRMSRECEDRDGKEGEEESERGRERKGREE